MTRYERCKKLYNAIDQHGERASVALYRNLLETHSALYARALVERYETPVRTLAFQARVYAGLAESYRKAGAKEKVNEYRIKLERIARRLINKMIR